MDEELQDLEKPAPGELEAPTVFRGIYMSYVQYMRYEHHRERFASKVVTRIMVPPYSVLQPSCVKTSKDIQKGESIGGKIATTM